MAALTTDGPMIASVTIPSPSVIDVIDIASAGTSSEQTEGREIQKVIIVANELEADIARRALSAWHYEVIPVKTAEDAWDLLEGDSILLITRHGLTVDEGLSLVLRASYGEKTHRFPLGLRARNTGRGELDHPRSPSPHK